MSLKPGSVRKVAASGGRRRGRPSLNDVAVIDKAILEAARDEFLNAGYEAATMDGIAAAAGVSKGTLYARYAAKEALFRNVVKMQFKALDERASQENHRLPSDFEQRLRWHAGTLVNSARWPEYKILFAIIHSATASFPDMAKLLYEIGPEATVKFMAEDMKASFPGSGVEKIDWHAYACLFVHSIGGWFAAESSVRDVPLEEATAFGEKMIRVILTSLQHDRLDQS